MTALPAGLAFPRRTVADAVKAAAVIAQAVSVGELTPSEASDLSVLVANYAKAIEISDLEARFSPGSGGQP